MSLPYVAIVFLLILTSMHGYRVDLAQASIMSKGQAQKASKDAHDGVQPNAFGKQRDEEDAHDGVQPNAFGKQRDEDANGTSLMQNRANSESKVSAKGVSAAFKLIEREENLTWFNGSSQGQEDTRGNASAVLSDPLHPFKLKKHDYGMLGWGISLQGNTERTLTLHPERRVLSYTKKGSLHVVSLNLDKMHRVELDDDVLTIWTKERPGGKLKLEGRQAGELYALLNPLAGEIPDIIRILVREKIDAIREQVSRCTGPGCNSISFFDFDDTLWPTSLWSDAHDRGRVTRNNWEALTSPRESPEAEAEWDQDAITRTDDLADQLIAAQPGISVIVTNGVENMWVRPVIDHCLKKLRKLVDTNVILLSTRTFASDPVYPEWKFLSSNKDAVFPLVVKALARQNIKVDTVYSYGDSNGDMTAARGLVEKYNLASKWIGVRFGYYYDEDLEDQFTKLSRKLHDEQRKTKNRSFANTEAMIKEKWLAYKKMLLGRFLIQSEELVKLGKPPAGHMNFEGPIFEMIEEAMTKAPDEAGIKLKSADAEEVC